MSIQDGEAAALTAGSADPKDLILPLAQNGVMKGKQIVLCLCFEHLLGLDQLKPTEEWLAPAL